MKIFIPRNVSKGLFNMSITMGPLSVSVFQLIILAIGLGIGLGIRQTLVKSGVGKITAGLIGLPVILLFIFIAFFKYSELTLLPFTAKMIKTYFLDVTKKYQINRSKPDPKVIALAKSRRTDQETIIEYKELVIDQEKMDRLTRIID